MQRNITRKLLAGLVASLFIPLGAQAADAELMKKIEAMAKEIESLRAQVQANQEANRQAIADVREVKEKVQKSEEKSLDKWLTVGGDYQFRVDSLAGETKSFTDVNAFFAAAQTDAMSNPAMMGQMIAFSGAMSRVQTFQQANAFLGANAAMIGGLMPYAAQAAIPAYKPKNETLYTNRFGLDLNMKATQDVSVTARLLMYKTFGASDEGATTNSGSAPFFADRVGVFDGTLGHIPSSSFLNVDRVYATWSNIADQDIWFSVGRRPSTHGAPSHLRANTARPGTGGTPALLVDYAFDGMTIGWAPDIDALPGAYGKLCYGRGFESGFSKALTNSLEDTDMVGLSVVPIDTDPLRVWLQWNRGMSIFDAPKMASTYFGTTMPKTNLGDIDWFGTGALGTIKRLGPGDLNWFADVGMSVTHPNDNVSSQFGFQGLMTGAFFSPEAPTSKTGSAVYVGLRYDLPSKTKLGVEYNHGSKNWITFAPAASDSWTSKVGTRGNVYEVYAIQELNAKPISSVMAKSFFRLGFQYYDFQYTGSNNWIGAPVRISDVNGQMMTTAPLSKAYNAYATVEVKF
ncbi:DUF3373 domain-containing protein [Dechloromonas sp. HYN0024]|uniref:DUF3373 domain-containing protein n=1 Tax=Dechloromonas sp. HYN0024 TaxID=2231055 RepID=UPI000E448D0C|nr:DUF3373 domain-containing protein [Dechloromonas sp. HYN0024]AXS78659.1 DUF3373 family protein [Dechloromonas sp. HYN0024]